MMGRVTLKRPEWNSRGTHYEFESANAASDHALRLYTARRAHRHRAGGWVESASRYCIGDRRRALWWTGACVRYNAVRRKAGRVKSTTEEVDQERVRCSE